MVYILHFNIEHCRPFSFILVGDFNIDYFCTSIFCTPDFKICWIVSASLKWLLSLNILLPMANQTLIDLALLSDVSQLIECNSVPPLRYSDHSSIEIKLKAWNSRPPPMNQKRQVLELWFWQSLWTHWLCWLGLDLCDDMYSSLSAWQHKFSLLWRNIPHPTANSNSNSPWLSKSILRLIQKCIRLHKPRASTISAWEIVLLNICDMPKNYTIISSVLIKGIMWRTRHTIQGWQTSAFVLVFQVFFYCVN